MRRRRRSCPDSWGDGRKEKRERDRGSIKQSGRGAGAERRRAARRVCTITSRDASESAALPTGVLELAEWRAMVARSLLLPAPPPLLRAAPARWRCRRFPRVARPRSTAMRCDGGAGGEERAATTAARASGDCSRLGRQRGASWTEVRAARAVRLWVRRPLTPPPATAATRRCAAVGWRSRSLCAVAHCAAPCLSDQPIPSHLSPRSDVHRIRSIRFRRI